MGASGIAFSFDDYAQALRVQGMMAPSDLALLETVILAGLGLGALVLFVLMFVRRSGTAAAGFALVALVALGEAMLFGRLDFLTAGSETLIGTLTASALLLFVNAVLHTGRENVLIAGVSAAVIGLLLTLGGLTASGMPYSQQASWAMLGSTVLSAGLLVYAMTRDLRGNGFLGFSVILSILAAALMVAGAARVLDGVVMTSLPAILVAAGILLASLAAPFLGEEVRMPTRSEREAAMNPGMMPTSLFDDEDDHAAPQAARSFPARADRLPPRRQEPVFATEPPVRSRVDPPVPSFQQAPDPEPVREPVFDDSFQSEGEPVSNYWNEQLTAAPLEAAEDEYIWDALAQPEVRCGVEVLAACAARDAGELTPEGLRERLSPASLERYDEEVLGGGDPVSGPFEVPLETAEARFVFRGRRQVDHDGILMRIDGVIENVERAQRQRSLPAPAESAAAAAPAARPLPAGPAAGAFNPVVRLTDERPIAFEAAAKGNGGDPDEIKELIDAAGRRLATLLKRDPEARPFVVIDASQLAVRPGVVAAAVGKAVRVHELPRGAMVVALKAGDSKDVRDLQRMAEDVRKAGGGVALAVDDRMGRGVKFAPNMLLVSAMDIDLHKRSKRSVFDPLVRRFDAPILVRDVTDRGEAIDLKAQGATFAMGRAFEDLAVAEGTPAGGSANPLSSLRAGGLR